MYSQLTQLSLLQGMNATDLANIQKQAQFFSAKSGSPVSFCKQGEICSMLIFLVEGNVLRHFSAPNDDFVFEETLQASWIIEPESLYGLHCRFSSDYMLMENSVLMTLSKQDMAKLFMRNEIFRMNYVNNLSAGIQQLREVQLFPFTPPLERRLFCFISRLAYCANGSKVLKIKMENLANYLNETRLNVSRALNHWQDLGLAELHRKEIYITQFECLAQHVFSI